MKVTLPGPAQEGWSNGVAVPGKSYGSQDRQGAGVKEMFYHTIKMAVKWKDPMKI